MSAEFNLENIPVVDIFLKREGELERRIAAASIYCPVEVLQACRDFTPKVNKSVIDYWQKLKSKEKDLKAVGDDACMIAFSLIDGKIFNNWLKCEKPLISGIVAAKEALESLKAYRYSRVCLSHIQDEIIAEMAGLVYV